MSIQGEKITIRDGRLDVPSNPVIPFIEGDGIGPDIWRASVRVFDAAVEKAYGGARKIFWTELLAGQKAFDKTRQLAAAGDSRRVQGVPCGHQRPPHNPNRRRDKVAERRFAAGARPVRLPAPGALFQRRGQPRQAPRPRGHGDIPREHRGHLRGHRIRARLGRRRKAQSVFEGGISRKVRESPLPGIVRNRDKARLAGGHGEARQVRHRVRDCPGQEERHARPQGQP